MAQSVLLLCVLALAAAAVVSAAGRPVTEVAGSASSQERQAVWRVVMEAKKQQGYKNEKPLIGEGVAHGPLVMPACTPLPDPCMDVHAPVLPAGIMTQPCHDCPGRSYIAAGFVKWIESAGGRAVPIRWAGGPNHLAQAMESLTTWRRHLPSAACCRHPPLRTTHPQVL